MKLKPDQQKELSMLLPALDLFKNVEPAALEALVPLAEVATFAKNKTVLMEQELAQQIFILAKGRVSIWRHRGSDKELVATLTAPNFFGEISVFAESSANAQVKTYDDCLVYSLKKEDLQQVGNRFPSLTTTLSANMKGILADRPAPEKRADD